MGIVTDGWKACHIQVIDPRYPGPVLIDLSSQRLEGNCHRAVPAIPAVIVTTDEKSTIPTIAAAGIACHLSEYTQGIDEDLELKAGIQLLWREVFQQFAIHEVHRYSPFVPANRRSNRERK
jgi:hypothetical protein